MTVPNASDAAVQGPSPDDGHVLAVADWRYGPNREGLHRLLSQVWPAVRAQQPSAQLILVGRGVPASLPEGVTGIGFIDDLTGCYADAAVVVAPAESGGGTQLKVVDAVARGRVVVAPPFGRASLPPHARDVCPITDDLAEAVVALLRDVADRHRREAELRAGVVSWAQATEPLRRWLDQVVSCA